jgi:DNA-binding beta-propeller fold protein YncE
VDGQGEDAHFYGPSRLTTDDAGNVYVTDAASVRKVTPEGVVTTVLAGPGPRSELARKPALSALVRDPAGNLYLTEGKTIRKLTPGGVTTLLAGNPAKDGFRDGRGPAARFAGISGLALDAAGNVYAADCRNAAVRKITPAGVVTTIAGRAGRSGVATGPFPEANLCYPSGLAFTPAGDLMDVMGNGLFRITAAR